MISISVNLSSIIELGVAAFIGSFGTIGISWLILRKNIDSTFQNHIQTMEKSNKQHEDILKNQSELLNKEMKQLFENNREIMVLDFKLKTLVKASSDLLALRSKLYVSNAETKLEAEKNFIKVMHTNMDIKDCIHPVLMFYDQQGLAVFTPDNRFGSLQIEIDELLESAKAFDYSELNKKIEEYATLNQEWYAQLLKHFYIFAKHIHKSKYDFDD